MSFKLITFVLILFIDVFTFGQNLDYSECFVTKHECPNKNVSFYLYTRDTQNSPHHLDMTDSNTISNANFIKNRPVIILIHGYTGHKDFSPNPSIRPAYLMNNGYNVISLDYNPLVREPCYFNAIQNLEVVSNCTAQLLDHLINESIIDLNLIHVIGFSLGAHTAGMISNFLKSGKLKRITGLDPAMPGFIFAPPDKRLDKSDAEFVDIIHTNIFERGIFQPIGHIDFYPNNGHGQPGCPDENNDNAGSCDHDRAPLFYAESVNTKTGFWGSPCMEWLEYVGLCRAPFRMYVIAGAYTPTNSSGIYYFKTNSVSPFALGRSRTKSHNSFSEIFNLPVF